MARTTQDRRNKLLERFERSNLTQREFAERHDLNLGTFRRWLYAARRDADAAEPQVRFVEVTTPTAVPVMLQLGAVRLELSNLPPVDYIVALARAVELC